jgi:pectate lyase
MAGEILLNLKGGNKNMIKCFKKAISSVLAAAMLATSFTAMPINTFAATSFSAAGGWFETLYAEWAGNKSDVTAVSYSGTASGSLTGDDLTYLVRQDGSNVRLDIPGLKAGTYNLTVTTNSGTITKNNIKVYEYDRTGYAHYDAHKEGVNGIGAYNDDGTLKSNAVVVYVTEENKNTVQLPGYTGSQYPAGIGNILNYKSADANGVTGGGKTDIVKQLREEGIPLDVRFLGTIRGGDSNTSNNPPAENIKGLTGYNTPTNGGTKGDNGMMIRVYKSSNVTFEGIGDDATLDGWGIQVISQTGFVSQGLEFRNLNFTNTPEDAIGLEGTASLSSSPQSKDWLNSSCTPIKFSWVHNNTFHQGFCKNPAESDKAEGDGSCDWKRGYGYTMAYNHYINNHKTNLVGSSSQSIQYDASFHHNWYEGVMSRQPLARQANIHIYNTYFDGATSYAISPRAHAYIFSEGNYFGACKNPVDSAKEGSATVKSYNDSFAGCNGTNAAQQVTNKTDKVSDSSGNPYAGFETGSDMYEYTATSPIQAKADCLNLAGVMKTASEINMEPTPEPIVTENPNALTLPYELNCTDPTNANYWAKKISDTSLTANTKYNMGGALVTPIAKISNTATNMKIRDNGVIFKVNTGANVTITAGASSAYGIELYDAYGELKLAVAGGKTATVSNIPAGVYVIKSGNTQKDGYLDDLKVVAYDPNAPTVTEATTETTTKANTGDDGTTETTTSGTVVDDGYVWHDDGVDASGNNVAAANSNIFNINGNDTTNKYTYNGVTYNSGIKMESSTNITVNAPADGALKLVLSAAGSRTIKIDGEEQDVVDGLNVFDLTAGTHTITKGTANVYLYVMSYAVDGGDTTVTTTTEATTEATTKEATEATTATPVDGVKVVVDNETVKNGSAVTVPVKLTGMTDLADFNITLTYDSAALTATKVENGDIINDSKATINSNITDGSVRIAGINPADTINANGTVLVKVTFTANKEGATPVAITVNTLKGGKLAVANYTTSNGTVTVTANGGSVETSTETTTTTETDSTTEATTVDYSTKGDVNKDGKIDEKDAALILKFIQGIKDETFYDEDAADANGDGVINVLDATWVLNHKGNTSKPSTPETKTYTLTGTDINATSGTALTADTNVGTENMFLAKTGVKNASGSVQISGSKTVQFKLTSDGTVALTNAISSGAYARQVAIVNSNGDTVATLDVENKNGAKNNLSATSLVAGTYTIKGVNVDSNDKSTSGGLNSSVNIGTITVTGTLEQVSAEATTKATTTETTTETTTKATTTTTTEATTETTTVTPAGDIVATINASDLTAGDITANTVSGQFKLIADATNKLTVEANSKSLDGYTFTQRLKTNGTGAVDKRAISFTTTGAGNVIFYAMSGSNKEDRPVNLLNAEGTTVGTVTVSGTTFAKYTIAIPSAGTYYLVSGKSGINFYLIGTDVALADQKADATTVTTTTTETSTEATTATTTTKADDTTETTTTAPAGKAFAVSGDSWSAENDSVPTWLNGGKLTTATNNSGYTAFAAESANGTAFTKTVEVTKNTSFTIDVADALTASVFIAGDNNTANKGVIKATFTDESGTVTDITPTNASLGGRKTATTAFELVATGKGTITVTPNYNSLLYKVAVK